MSTQVFAAGGYRFIPAVFQYSAGVAAEGPYSVEHFIFDRPPALAEGFRRAADIIKQHGRPLTAFCACELRSPGQFTDEGFRAFNEFYCGTLTQWGIYDPATKVNPVARSNVCPEVNPPTEPIMYAFSFTVAKAVARPTFVVSGSGEAHEGAGAYSTRTVRHGETSAEAMREKARHVLGAMEQRQKLLGVDWSRTTASQVYTVRDLYPFLADEIVARGAARCGLTWHFARPPVQGLEYEMDCRGVAEEHFV